MGKLKRCLALSACLVIALCGCSNTKDVDTKSKKTVISIWTNDRSEMDVRQKQVEKFNSENNEIQIDYSVKGDDINSLLTVALQGGTAPDIYPAQGRSVIDAGYASPLPDDYVEELSDRLLPGALSPAHDGKYYAARTEITTYKLVWNKDLFSECGLDPEKPPKTWAELEKYAKIITKKGNGAKYGFALPFKSSAFVRYYVGIPGAVDGNFNEDGYDIHTGDFCFDIYKPLLEIYQRMNNENVLFPTPLSLDNDTARAQFSNGNIGMLMAVSWDVGVFNDQFPAVCDWGVAEMPSLTGEVKGGYPYGIGGTGYMLNSSTKDKEAQLKVYDWLISDENMQELSLAGKGPFAFVATQDEKFIAKEKKGAVEFTTVSEPKRIALGAQGYIPPITLEGDDWFTVFVNVITQNHNIDDAIKDLNKRYNAAKDKYFKDKGENPEDYIIPDYDYSIGIIE